MRSSERARWDSRAGRPHFRTLRYGLRNANPAAFSRSRGKRSPLAGATDVKMRPIRPIHRMCTLPDRLSPGGVVCVSASPPSPGSGGRSASGEAERAGFIGVIAFESFSPASEADSHIVSEMTRRATRAQWTSPNPSRMPAAEPCTIAPAMGFPLAARVNVVEALGRLGDECVIPCLTGALHEADSSVCRRGGARHAGRWRGAEKALVAALNWSKSERVTVIAGRTPERLRGHRAHEGLTENCGHLGIGTRLSVSGWETCAVSPTRWPRWSTTWTTARPGTCASSWIRFTTQSSRKVGCGRRGAGRCLPRTSMSAMRSVRRSVVSVSSELIAATGGILGSGTAIG